MTQRLSAVTGPPLSEEAGIGALTLGGFLAELAEQYPNNDALSYRDSAGIDHRWTFSELYNESLRVAQSLLARGVSKDARVGILMTNRPQWVMSVFGAAMAGAVGVALNTFSTQREFKHQLQISDVEILLMEGLIVSHDFLSDLHELCPELNTASRGEIRSMDLPYLRRVVVWGDCKALSAVEGWDEFLDNHRDISPELVEKTNSLVSPIDNGLIFFSSGSTAIPKAIQQTHRAATLQCWRWGKWFEADSSVRCWSANGFFFSGNFAMAFGGALSVGGCLVLQKYFNPDEALDILQREKVSLALAWPHQEARLQECEGWCTADFSSLFYVDANISAFAQHPTVNSTWRQPNGYGSTETFTLVTGVAANLAPEGSHGEVLPGNSIRIVDPDTGDILPWGETGEIIVKGLTLTPGYLKIPPEQTFDEEGFLHTADAGYFREDGHLHWEGRLGDIIKTGGANVSPAEIDAVLVEHEGIQEAYTVGMPDELLGELVVSCVVPREGCELTEDEVRAFAKKSLASFKVPRKILFFEEKELPMTGSNKIRRGELKKLVIQRLLL